MVANPPTVDRVALRKQLAERYPGAKETARILRRAGFDTSRINLDQAADGRWFEALREVAKHNDGVTRLLAAVERDSVAVAVFDAPPCQCTALTALVNRTLFAHAAGIIIGGSEPGEAAVDRKRLLALLVDLPAGFTIRSGVRDALANVAMRHHDIAEAIAPLGITPSHGRFARSAGGSR